METENIQIEPQKFSDAQVILQYIFGGKSTFTLQSVASGERFTYKISESAKRPGDSRPPVFFVSVLTGPDNSDNFRGRYARLLPLALIVLNVLVFIRIKSWRVLSTFLPLLILTVVIAAEWRDRLVAWRVL
jgi:hypothetical protein